MNCTNCGSSVVAGAKFCENCGMAVQAKPEPKVEERSAPESPATAKTSVTKMVPQWFVIASMVLSLLTALGIVGLFIPAVKAKFDPLTYALIALGATVGPATLFYIFMLIFFLAKRYGHGSKLIPLLHIILYVIAGGGVVAASGFLFQSQIALVLLGAASGISFVMLCMGLYFLLREKPQN